MRRVSESERDPAAKRLYLRVLIIYEMSIRRSRTERFLFFPAPEALLRKEILMTREEKNAQIRREARATVILFCICFLWHVGCAYLLSGTGITVCGLPLWWILSTPGVFVIAVVGVVILLKKVFVNFSLEDEGEGTAEEVQA